MSLLAYDEFYATIAPLIEVVLARIEPLIDGATTGTDIYKLVNFSLDEDLTAAILDAVAVMRSAANVSPRHRRPFPPPLRQALRECRRIERVLSKHNAGVSGRKEDPAELHAELVVKRTHFRALLAEWHQSQWAEFVAATEKAQYYLALQRLASIMRIPCSPPASVPAILSSLLSPQL